MNFTSIDSLSPTDGSPLTTIESNSSSQNPSPIRKGILEGNSQNHTISAEPPRSTRKVNFSEVHDLIGKPQEEPKPKSSLSFLNPITDFFLKPQEEVSIINITPDDIDDVMPTRPNTPEEDRKVAFLSRNIQKWASDLAAQKASDLKDLEDALSYLKKNPTALSPETKGKLEESLPIIKDQSTKTEKYALWTNYRTELLKGSKKVQQALEKAGQTINEHWTEEELRDDWELTKAEPWTQDDHQYDELKTIIAPLTAQHRQTQKELAEAKTTMRSFAEEVKQAERKQAAAATARNSARQKSSHSQTSPAHREPKPPEEVYENSARESREDIVSVPGVGDVDRNLYDIGDVEHHEDGTYTITDMTGRRYDYPTPTPQKGDSCTIS